MAVGFLLGVSDPLSYVVTTTDHDLVGAFAWQSYTVTPIMDPSGAVLLQSAEALLDDGRSVLFENAFFSVRGMFLMDHMDRWTGRDAEGRLDYIIETNTGIPPAGPFWDTTFKALDYDPASGRLDYSFMRYLGGQEQAIDNDITTGQRDYVLTREWNGRTVAEDFDSTTGLIDYRYATDPDGHSLSQDYDAAGRLDYAVERWADGRMLVTDHDLLDSMAGPATPSPTTPPVRSRA